MLHAIKVKNKEHCFEKGKHESVEDLKFFLYTLKFQPWACSECISDILRSPPPKKKKKKTTTTTNKSKTKQNKKQKHDKTKNWIVFLMTLFTYFTIISWY